MARYDPLVAFTLNRANRILASSPMTFDFLKTKFPNKVEFYGHSFKFPEIKQNKLLFEVRNIKNNFIQLIWMGQLIPRKGLELLINALSDVRLSNCFLDILGDGPEKKRYIRLARKFNVDNRIRFLGHIERSQALKKLAECDIFVFTSLQDMMGQALSEAMQIGLPCVVMNWSGPSALVGNNGAAKVPVSSFSKTCKNLADKLSELCNSPKLRIQLAINGKKRIIKLTDPVKLEKDRNRIFFNVVYKDFTN
jgi:glycosyltransferase involved in cell wall biosynthesis